MIKRSVIGVIVLCFITFGIYPLVWLVKTKNEMNRVGASIPTAWWLIVPIGNIWWQWKYCEGVGQVTRGKLSGPVAFLMLFMLSIIGMVIIQVSLNEAVDNLEPTFPSARIA